MTTWHCSRAGGHAGSTRIDRYIRVEAIVGVPIPPVEAAARR